MTLEESSLTSAFDTFDTLGDNRGHEVGDDHGKKDTCVKGLKTDS